MAICKIEEKEDIGISSPNFFDLGSSFDLSLHFAFLQVA